ncbi:Uncharacterised protein [Amycolatopsis camponoti]|uniref:Uncharacterized protein n=1 Tax=Amycolatopsis camponoti TaxID=2606593 RepID=A0A6I8LY35_9PSEU|nr:Uncharacterised protein [Amycolatopsis camponoti]
MQAFPFTPWQQPGRRVPSWLRLDHAGPPPRQAALDLAGAETGRPVADAVEDSCELVVERPPRRDRPHAR